MNYGYYSSVALVSSVVVYLLAFFAHAAEWASARRVGATEVAEQRELVTAGAPSGSSGSSDPVLSRESLTREIEDELAGRRVEQFGRIGVMLTVFGFSLSVIGVVGRGLAAGRGPWGNMYEFTITAMVAVVAAYLIMVWKADLRWLGLPVTLLATRGQRSRGHRLLRRRRAPGARAALGVVPDPRQRRDDQRRPRSTSARCCRSSTSSRSAPRTAVRSAATSARIPSSRRIDLITYRFHAFAFPLWTFTVVAGAIWAEYAWGRYWGWDPKETWAFVTWVIYACYLHARSTAGWRGNKAAVIAIVGMASFWFNFIGVNLLVSGLHSYAGV